MLPEGTILKPGDELARDDGWTFTNYAIVKVKHITPKGFIVLENGITYDQRGLERTTSSRRSKLSILTDEIRAKIIREKRLDYIRHYDWKNASDVLLAEVAEVMRNRGHDCP